MSLITTPPPSRRPIKNPPPLSPHDPESIRTAIRQELDRGVGRLFYVGAQGRGH